MRNNAAEAHNRAPVEHDDLVPVAIARSRIEKGKTIARQTVFSLAARGEIDVRLVAGRFVVTSASIRAYRERRADAALATAGAA